MQTNQTDGGQIEQPELVAAVDELRTYLDNKKTAGEIPGYPLQIYSFYPEVTRFHTCQYFAGKFLSRSYDGPGTLEHDEDTLLQNVITGLMRFGNLDLAGAVAAVRHKFATDE